MSDNYTEPLDDDDDENDGPEDFKNLRAKARKADKIERELAQAKRELAFVKAGIPMDDPKMGYFVKGYEGDLEADKIREAAYSAGFMQAPEKTPDPLVEQARQGQQRVMNASQGTEPSFDPTDGLRQMEQAFAEGGLDAMFGVAQQYGVGLETNEI